MADLTFSFILPWRLRTGRFVGTFKNVFFFIFYKSNSGRMLEVSNCFLCKTRIWENKNRISGTHLFNVLLCKNSYSREHMLKFGRRCFAAETEFGEAALIYASSNDGFCVHQQ